MKMLVCLQDKIQGLSTDEMRHLCNVIAKRNPALVQEILEEQERGNSGITEQRQAEQPPTWCVCQGCRDMPTAQERVCCANSPTNCLSLVPEMSEVVLHQGVLRVADTYRRAIFGIPLETDDNCRFRHSAYRQFTVWRYGRLGSRVRRVIPSCCVWRIRDRYPNPLGQYTGFLPQRRTEMSEVVLHQGVLRVADTYRRAIFGIPLETDDNRRLRHSAYRQFTVWRYGRLGSRVRRVIPSCCVWRIRDRYPNPLGQYTGFLPQRRTVTD
ncbi:uncharacterized protein LOC122801349 [Protopterus annectens]|uniref:uncharacterized protein LOC122801349 n=1 Tax=Protopterus annectens TaxID=7888 RepID=UPI001CFB9A17|nr:uncharacterized protein LOC122801349 [Protopterus annectens]